LLLSLLPRNEFSGGGNNQHEERERETKKWFFDWFNSASSIQFCDSSVSPALCSRHEAQAAAAAAAEFDELICQGRPIRNAFENEPNGGLAGRDSDRREHSADTTAVGG
jgi:hypothetical protein